jgi:Carboxypeptidase regulatory-like domain
MKKLVVVLALLTLAMMVVAATDDRSSDLQFVVIRDYNGKPVRNASVILHPLDKNGRQGKGGLQLKTDADGKTSFDGVPYGTLRIQVLATGFQTFGQDYDVNQPTMAITVRLKRPTDQYSIYDDKNQKPPEKKDDKQEPPK